MTNKQAIFLVGIVIVCAGFLLWQQSTQHRTLVDDLTDRIAKAEQERRTDRANSGERVARVIDGDTFDLANGQRVRMLGIDTPERGDVYYKEAQSKLQELLAGKAVRLENDVRDTDRYGRLLRHVYVDDVWINAQMIQDGYARMVTYPPDVAHVEHFRSLEQQARSAERGLWQYGDRK